MSCISSNFKFPRIVALSLGILFIDLPKIGLTSNLLESEEIPNPPINNSSATTSYTFGDLKRDLCEREKELEKLIIPEVSEYVLTVGPTGAGKSTCINLLAKKPFDARENDDGELEIYTNHPLDRFKIEGGIHSQTIEPTLWHDEDNKRGFIDFPGLGDSRGAHHDILTAFSIYFLMTKAPKIKLLLTVSEGAISTKNKRGRIFLSLLSDITQFFEDEEDLTNAFAFLVTDQVKLKPCKAFKSRYAALEGEKEISQEAKKRIKPLLKSTIDELGRIASLSYPSGEGPYAFDPSQIHKSLELIEGVTKPRILLSVNAESRVLAQRLAQVCNDEMKSILKSNMAPEIEKKCESLVDQHAKPARELKKDFAEFTKSLQTLREESALEFTHDLERFLEHISIEFDLGKIKETGKHVDFLKRLNPEIRSEIGNWKSALFNLTSRITALATAPEKVEKKEYSTSPWRVGDSGHGSSGDYWVTDERIITTFPSGNNLYGNWTQQGNVIYDPWVRVHGYQRTLNRWHRNRKWWQF